MRRNRTATERPLDDLLSRFRGRASLASRSQQAADRAVFGEVGWGWLDHRCSARDLDGGRVLITGEAPDGVVSTWEAAVAVRRELPVPDCGQPVEVARKSEREMVVTALERVG